MQERRIFFVTLFFLAILSQFGNVLWAQQSSIVSNLTTDSLIKDVGSSVTILYTVVNNTPNFWTPTNWTTKYHFEVFDINDPQHNGGSVGGGDLVYTQEQYVGPNSSTAFAIGTFVLQDQKGKLLRPGLYRILLFAYPFRNTATGTQVELAASTAIRILRSNR